MIGPKLCVHCGEIKEPEAFGYRQWRLKHAGTERAGGKMYGEGLRSWCKQCNKEYCAGYRRPRRKRPDRPPCVRHTLPKHCGKCRKTKGPESFYVRKLKTGLSLSSWCKECNKIRYHERYASKARESARSYAHAQP